MCLSKTGYKAISADKVSALLCSLQLQAHGLMYPGWSDAAFLPCTQPWQQLTVAHSPVLQPRAAAAKEALNTVRGLPGGNISPPSPS